MRLPARVAAACSTTDLPYLKTSASKGIATAFRQHHLGLDLAIDANFTGSGGIATFIGNTFGNNNAIISHSGMTRKRAADDQRVARS